MLAQRRRGWANIRTTLVERLGFSGSAGSSWYPASSRSLSASLVQLPKGLFISSSTCFMRSFPLQISFLMSVKGSTRTLLCPSTAVRSVSRRCPREECEIPSSSVSQSDAVAESAGGSLGCGARISMGAGVGGGCVNSPSLSSNNYSHRPGNSLRLRE